MESFVDYYQKTFRHDRLVRNAKGEPLGRIVLAFDNDYEQGQDNIKVLLLRVPLVNLTGKIEDFKFYVDGYLYEIPKNIPSFRINKRDNEFVVSSFLAKRC